MFTETESAQEIAAYMIAEETCARMKADVLDYDFDHIEASALHWIRMLELDDPLPGAIIEMFYENMNW